MQTSGNQTGEVRHVDPQVRTDLVGDGAEGSEVLLTRVGGPTGDDDLRLLGEGDGTHLVHVDAMIFLADAVGRDVVQLARS